MDYSDIHNLSLGHYIDVNSAKILKVTGGEIEMTALIEYYDFNVRRILTAPVRFFTIASNRLLSEITIFNG